ncbi:MAG: creatininase [Anaerolineales bacterium]|nr:MAG: creatininase [Anaerolineales bacterium]
MKENNPPNGFIPTNQPDLFFEDNPTGRMKKEIWEATDHEIDTILTDYGIPSPVEWGKPGSYIQTTTRWQVEENRKRNDVVFIPVGCTELHGRHLPSAADTLYVSAICEGVRRYTARRGAAVNLALPPLMYGGHPYHHLGMPGTVIVREHVVREMMIDVMLGLWNDGFRKQLIVNNHGQLWMLESAVQEFQKRYQLPGIYRVIDWHRGVREFFRTSERGGQMGTNFVHADECETSLSLLLHPEMVDMGYAVNTEGKNYLPDGHFDKSVDPFGRPSRWSEGEGHFAIEIKSTPEGVVGKAKDGSAYKARRPIAAILKYLTLWNDDILAAFPPGKVPPVEEVTLRSAEEMEPFLREPLSPGWKTVYSIPRIGQGTEV